MAQKYYWLKMPKDFMTRHDVRMIKRRLGFEGVIYYLSLLLESIDHDGDLRFSKDLAYDIETLSDAIDAEIVTFTKLVRILRDKKMMIKNNDGTFHLPFAIKCLGSETQQAERTRVYRERLLKSQCDDNVTDCDGNVTPKSSNIPKGQASHSDIELEKELEIELEIDKEKVKRVYVEGDFELELSTLLKTKILANNPNAKTPDNLQSWSKVVDLMFRIDKRTPEQIKTNIIKCQHDPFWKTNILSMAALRKQFDKITMMNNSSSKQPQAKSFLEMYEENEKEVITIE